MAAPSYGIVTELVAEPRASDSERRMAVASGILIVPELDSAHMCRLPRAGSRINRLHTRAPPVCASKRIVNSGIGTLLA